jgi:hypothetical protein
MRLLVSLLCLAGGATAADDSWKLPLHDKEQILERNNQKLHNILGLYPSQVEVPLDGRPVDNSTLGIGNIAHSICWTSYYLAGASIRYAFLKKTGAPKAEVDEARRRADELFESVYRCQLVTGEPGLQARGYAIGHGESYEERWNDSKRDAWRQGQGEYKDLRWRGDPSHHNYSGAVRGMGVYYDLAAEGAQKERCRKAIHSLVSYWVDNDLIIYDYGRTRPEPILGITDGKTLNTRVMMAIAGAKTALHATGDPKFQAVYERLLQQYGVRGLKTFQTSKNHDDAEHVFVHLENLFRTETDGELLAAYRKVADGLWANHKDDAQSLFTYIYLHIAPDARGREKALREALFSLQTYPTDMTLRPTMSSLHKDLRPPYPVYAAAWDNEYMWKGSLLHPDGWLSRIVTGVAVPAEDPMVIYAIDTNGDLYQSRDGAASAAGWRPIDGGLHSPVRAIDAGPKVRMVFAACDDGFYMSPSGGYSWERLPVPADGGKPVDISVDPANANVIYAVTTKGAWRSLDFSAEFLGRSWESLTAGLPEAAGASYFIAPGKPGRAYAILNDTVFARRLDESGWKRGGTVGLGQYAKPYGWLAADPSNPDHAWFGVKTAFGRSSSGDSLLQETLDAGLAWSNSRDAMMAAYVAGRRLDLVAAVVPGEIGRLAIDPRNSAIAYAASGHGVLKSTDGGKTWKEKKDGLDIPVIRSVLAPRGTDWIFAGTPAGLFVSKDGGESWRSGELVLQFIKNTRRDVGGAAYIDAYWRGRYYGFISDAEARAPWREKPGAAGE